MKEAKARSQAELYATNMEKVTIGGQAVLEGVMMRNKGKYAVAVRKPDKEIDVKVA